MTTMRQGFVMYPTQPPPAKAAQFRSCNRQQAVMDVGAVLGTSGKPVGSPRSPAILLKPRGPAQLAAASKLAMSLDYMMAHLNESIRISTLCALTGYSQARFFDLFKSVTGDSPLNWFIRARMQWAAELLENSALPIKQIAWQIGYRDQLYFSRRFKSVFGISPSEFRSQKESAVASTNNKAVT